MTDEVEQKPESTKPQPPPDSSRHEGQFTDQAKQGDWTQATEGNVLNARFNPLSEKNLSDLKSFKDAFNEDLANLSDARLDELQLSARGAVAARDEVFANMYGHASGRRASIECNSAYSQKLKKSFPNCLKQLDEEI